jgi:hypothetical protein
MPFGQRPVPPLPKDPFGCNFPFTDYKLFGPGGQAVFDFPGRFQGTAETWTNPQAGENEAGLSATELLNGKTRISLPKAG